MRILFLLVIPYFLTGCIASNYTIDRLYEEDYDTYRLRVSWVDFCSLPQHEGTIIRTKAVYSGFQEYWSVTPVEPCDDEFAADFSVCPGFAFYPMPILPWQFLRSRKLNKVHNKYWVYDAVLDMEGYFVAGDEIGYGHMNTYSSMFVITYIRSIQLTRKYP